MGGPGYITPRDKLQVNAFKAIYKTLEGTLEERFANAIALTSDKAYERAIKRNPQAIQDFLKKNKRKKKP